MTNRYGQAPPEAARSSADAEPAGLLVPVLTAGWMLGIGRTKVDELVGAGELELVHIRCRALVPVESEGALAWTVAEAGVLLLVGYSEMTAIGAGGVAWRTGRLGLDGCMWCARRPVRSTARSTAPLGER